MGRPWAVPAQSHIYRRSYARVSITTRTPQALSPAPDLRYLGASSVKTCVSSAIRRRMHLGSVCVIVGGVWMGGVHWEGWGWEAWM